MNVQVVLQEGLDHHRAGRMADAARCYKRVLEADPGNADALNLMSALALVAGDPRAAAALALGAISAQPGWAAPHVSLGNALQAAGRADQAVDAFQKAIALAPETAEAYVNLASALNDLGRFGDAVKMAVEAIVIDSSLAEAHNIFGNALVGLGSPEEAVEAYQKAVYLRPEWDAPWFNIGVALAAQGKHDEAAAVYGRSIRLADGAAKHYNLGNSLAALGRLAEAEAEYRAALAVDPGYTDASNNLSVMLKDQERLEEAAALLEQALAHTPDSADLHWNLALARLMAGDWRRGWQEYEWRWRMPTFRAFTRDFGCPVWDGGDPAGKTVLVSAEQGFGDAIEFCRFVPALAARGAVVTLECRQGLKRLFGTLDGVARVVSPGEPYGGFDLTVPLMSLPHRLGLDLADLPARLPYLAVPAAAGDFSDVAALPGRKVGLVWAGGDSRRDNARRSCRATDLLALQEVPGCRFFSLQVGPAATQATDLPGVIDLSPRLGDFADTAAALAALDLVIAVDTAVVHLAGALGKPVWVLLSRPSNGFLWMCGRGDSPWYPRVARLWRQPAADDWQGLVRRVRDALAAGE